MIVSTKLKSFLCKNSDLDEIWLRDFPQGGNAEFWGFRKDGRQMQVLEGYSEGDYIHYDILSYDAENVEEILENFLQEKRESGYECACSRMRV